MFECLYVDVVASLDFVGLSAGMTLHVELPFIFG